MIWGTGNLGGGAAGYPYGMIRVSYPEHSILRIYGGKASKHDISRTERVYYIKEPSEYTLIATDKETGASTSKTVVVSSFCYGASIVIASPLYIMKQGVYTDATISKYQGSCSEVNGTGYTIYKMTDNNWSTWFTDNKIDVTPYSRMVVVLTGGKTRYWDRFGLRADKASLSTQNGNIFNVASVSTGANGSDTTINSELTLSTDISSINGSYWFGFTLEGTSSFNDGTYAKGGFKVTDMYLA